MKAPVRVAVTGAAGNIGYALVFRIASGEMLGKDQPVILQMLELPMEKAQAALKGVMMELEDCAFPLLVGMLLPNGQTLNVRDTMSGAAKGSITPPPKGATGSQKSGAKPSPQGGGQPKTDRQPG